MAGGGSAGLAGGLVGAGAVGAEVASKSPDAILAQAGPSAAPLPLFLQTGLIPKVAMAPV